MERFFSGDQLKNTPANALIDLFITIQVSMGK
jgi:hypothetical protein